MNKIGGLTEEQIIELVLAVAGIAVLLLLFFSLYGSATYSKDAEGAKAYFDAFKKQIGVANNNGVGEFLIWDNDKIFLVYFGKHLKFPFNSSGKDDENSMHLFSVLGINENYICVCYDNGKGEDGKTVFEEKKYKSTSCDYCMSLAKPAEFSEKNSEGMWAVGKGVKLNIIKQDNVYSFAKVV